ncbi:TPA: ATP-binding protein [Acinetobacter baumannii]|uniref:ATP-binding protein n=2 Tax=Acinetobacter baumannii TaxID=470 RepID=UPI0001AEFA19|nr:ATP-binding protein [Acinetobacter baumannii]EHU1901146.1 ATP-binding protein [Acinetobacter baumannii]EHU1918250.1 ATP-binding protein [Acinetobacter baumannii]EHU1962184.1 ATP-binding protein [Acinetobacter baumannii]EKP44662.1 GHKL domain protein [Acinetobacter baumannii OIFC111]EKU3892404.1 ATP-binding protein [Acinetobacter baumannii]
MTTKTQNLKPIKIVAMPGHIKTLTEASATKALSELIWNGFDASSQIVTVTLNYNSMEGLDSIVVEDQGSGIPYKDVELFFGGIGDSWKKIKKNTYHHPLHGQNGKGRFKAFCLGADLEWKTTFEDQTAYGTYSIIGNHNKIEEFKTSVVEKNKNGKKGTKVTISNLHKKANELLKEKTRNELTKSFAVFLTEFPNLELNFNGSKIDPKSVQNYSKDYDLTEDCAEITVHPVKLTIIEWNIETERVINLCSSKGISLEEYEPKNRIKAKGFNFTAYLKSEYFQELENTGGLSLKELEPTVGKILDIAVSTIQEHFRKRIAEKYSGIVQEWKDQNIYPYQDKNSLTSVEKAEQEVFDILAANVQTFLPNFEKTEKTSKKFMFKLIAQAITENPESVQKIITEVLDLKKEDQDKLAELLDNTTLSSIISSATIVANRLNFLDELENLLFNEHTKKVFTERDQLHKILENEAWIFDEQFALSLSEERLEKVLEKHLSKLGDRSDEVDVSDPVILTDGRSGRIDLMLNKVDQPRDGEFDYLVVELKRPTKKIDADVLNQIEKYAIAVAEDERFLNVKARWTFLAISNELDAYATRKANQRNMPKSVVFQDGELNITVLVKSWAEVVANARAKLQFINQHLQYEVTQESSQKYLKKAHEKFIPKI